MGQCDGCNRAAPTARVQMDGCERRWALQLREGQVASGPYPLRRGGSPRTHAIWRFKKAPRNGVFETAVSKTAVLPNLQSKIPNLIFLGRPMGLKTGSIVYVKAC